MASNTIGIGRFTAENIVAVLRAIPESNGTYQDIASNARKQGANVSPHTVAKWVTKGHRDLNERKNSAFARFTRQFDSRLKENCSTESNRNRELDRALLILDRTCECGNEKMLDANGNIGDKCRNCQELDNHQRRNGSRRSTPRTAVVGDPRTGPME